MHPRYAGEAGVRELDVHEELRDARRVNLGTVYLGPHGTAIDGVEPGHTLGLMGRAEVRMLLSFQRPPHLGAKGDPSHRMRPRALTGSRHRTDEYSQFPASQQTSPLKAEDATPLLHSNVAGSRRRARWTARDHGVQRTWTRANRRLPSCNTLPSTAAAGRSSSPAGTGSPSIRTPPCASARLASEVETPNA